MTRTGKIARLPNDLRDQLNRRLHDGEKGKTLLKWLNALPEVRAVLAAEFNRQPIRPCNLTEWKQGGHRDWLVSQDAIHGPPTGLSPEGRRKIEDALCLMDDPGPDIAHLMKLRRLCEENDYSI